MKYLIIIILLFIAVNIFAIDQHLIDGVHEYNEAAIMARVIEKDRAEGWNHLYSDYDPDKEEVQYQEALALIKKFEPIKKEYDRQNEIEKRRRDIKGMIIGPIQILGLPIAFFIGLLFVFRLMIKRNKRLLREGKLTPKEYKKMMLSGKSSLFSDSRINPATGLPIRGGGVTDAGGNVRGSSSDRYYRYDRY